MSGERDLRRLFSALQPKLSVHRHTFAEAQDAELSPDVFAIVREDEVVTAIRVSPDGAWARISLGVHSSLHAVGLTAAISAALAERNVSANIIAGLHHDHILVPWEQREEALAALRGLSKD